MSDRETAIREFNAELRRVMSALPSEVEPDRRRSVALAQVAKRRPDLHRNFLEATNRPGAFAPLKVKPTGKAGRRAVVHGVLYEVRASAGDSVAELLIYDDIGRDPFGDGISAKDIADQLISMKGASTINVRINSVGGSVWDAIAIFNSLERHSARIVVDIEGVALSAASIIAMAGDEIRMASNALMMIHNPIGLGIGGAEDMRKTAELLDTCKQTIINTYARKTRQSESQISAWMDAETWFTADEAIAKRFAHKKTPAMKVAAIGDLSRFKNVPQQLR